MKIPAKQVNFTNHAFVNPIEFTSNYSHTQQSPHDLLWIDSSSDYTVTLPDPSTIPSGTIVSFITLGTGNLLIQPYNQSGTIDGQSTLTLNSTKGVCLVLLDATNKVWAGLSHYA